MSPAFFQLSLPVFSHRGRIARECQACFRDFWVGLNNGIQVETKGILPSPLVSGADYFIIEKTGEYPEIRIKLSSSPLGNPIDILSEGHQEHFLKSVGTFSLHDVRVITGGINTLDHYRGAVDKIEYFSSSDLINPVSEMDYSYAIKYNLKKYTMPLINDIMMENCATGDPNGTEPTKQADNLNKSFFIGFLRNTGVAEIRDKVVMRNEIFDFNEINGLASGIRKTNSDGRQRLEKTKYAITEKMADGTAVYQDMIDRHVFDIVSETIVYEKQEGSSETKINPEDGNRSRPFF